MYGDKEGFTRQHWGAREGTPASLSRIDYIFATDKVFFYVKVTTLLKSSWGLINKELACKWVYRLL